MSESITIQLQKRMPVVEQISEIDKRISEWIKSLDRPFDDEIDELRLEKYKRDNRGHIYHYVIERDAKIAKGKKMRKYLPQKSNDVENARYL